MRKRKEGKMAASVSRPRVWWLGRKRSAALDGGATGGMSADILLAHNIAAAKVRLQSLHIQTGREKRPVNPQTRIESQVRSEARRLSGIPAGRAGRFLAASISPSKARKIIFISFTPTAEGLLPIQPLPSDLLRAGPEKPQPA
jgi:hypothetical protein